MGGRVAGVYVLALTSLSPCRPEMLVAEHRVPSPAARHPWPQSWLSSAPAAARGGRGQSQAPAFHLLQLSTPASPRIIPMSNWERLFPSGPTGDGATQGHPLEQAGWLAGSEEEEEEGDSGLSCSSWLFGVPH